ncbi:MAG: hypothetical protein CENE_03299 [Candidatus Celerinatantimonas neptuna]|nr:MAG: hypothetical protein CENE_03299 [Candidatus Celerinatantimonas neptuna]
MNQVDTSPETVAREWDRISTDYKLDPETPEPVTDTPESPADTSETTGTTEPSSFDELEPETKKQLTKAAIGGVLNTGGFILGQVQLPTPIIDQASDAYSELLLKYFPKAGVIGLLDKYKIEITAATATWGLVTTYRQVRMEKRQQMAANDEEQSEETAA